MRINVERSVVGRPSSLLSSFQTPKGQFEKRAGRTAARNLVDPLSLHFFAFSAVGRLNNDCGVGGGGKSTQSATFRERVMVMMSMMAAGEPLEGEIEKKEGGRKEDPPVVGKVVTLSPALSLSLSDSLVFHSAFN